MQLKKALNKKNYPPVAYIFNRMYYSSLLDRLRLTQISGVFQCRQTYNFDAPAINDQARVQNIAVPTDVMYGTNEHSPCMPKLNIGSNLYPILVVLPVDYPTGLTQYRLIV